MTSEQAVAVVSAFTALVVAFTAMVASLQAIRSQVKATRLAVDGRMDELLALVKTSSRAEGKLEAETAAPILVLERPKSD